MSSGRISLQANDGKVLSLKAPEGMPGNLETVVVKLDGGNDFTGEQTIDGSPILSQNTITTNSYMAYGGTANAVTLTSLYGSPITSYKKGQQFRFRATATNTGAMTINVDGLGAKEVRDIRNIATVAGEIRTDVDTVVTYDGTNFIAQREIERGSNANGEYVKFADGTLICTFLGLIAGVASTPGIMTYTQAMFSSSFISEPSVSFLYIRKTGDTNGALLRAANLSNYLNTWNTIPNTFRISAVLESLTGFVSGSDTFSMTAKGEWK